MFCNHCGNQCAEGVAFCPSCGAALNTAPQAQQPAQPVQPVYQAPAQQTTSPSNGMAIASLICSIASIVCCCGGGPLAIAGVILGVLARSKDKENKMALIGMIVGIASFVIGVIVMIISYATGFAMELSQSLA